MSVGVFAGIPVSDFPRALQWYERFLGASPDFRPHDAEAVWQLAEQRYVYITWAPERAGGALCMIWVDDPVAEAARLGELGIQPDDVEKHGDIWKYVFHDDDGNEIGIGGDVSPA